MQQNAFYNFNLQRPPVFLSRRFLYSGKYAFLQKLSVTLACLYHLVNQSPLGQAANIPVVNKHVCLYLAAEMLIVARTALFWKITVDSIELDTTLLLRQANGPPELTRVSVCDDLLSMHARYL